MSSQLTACYDLLCIVYIGNVLEKKNVSYKNGQFNLKTKYFSIEINNITVIELKALVKQRGIKGYYKHRNAELIHKLETHSDVNE